jgi:adenylosuccinate synthase
MKLNEYQAILTADLGFGDAGKGSIVDALARFHGAHTVVRYNGGGQAAHNVVTPDGRHHTFAQFGSGSFIPDTLTYLSRFMIIQPLSMLAEERHLQAVGVDDAFLRMRIDRRALVTSPYQQSANRIKEMLRGDARHGSCGLGVGETMSDWLQHGESVLFAGDLPDSSVVVEKLRFMRDAKWVEIENSLVGIPLTGDLAREVNIFHDPKLILATAEVYQYFAGLVTLVDENYLRRKVRQPGQMLFEGAQGVLLDEWYGFHPYTSWSTYTFQNALTLLDEAGFDGGALKLGLTRAYATRHGAGPFVSEDRDLSTQIPDHHNGDNPWQRQFRVGHLDYVALRYALDVIGGVDGLVVTNLDRIASQADWYACETYIAPNVNQDLGAHFFTNSESVIGIRVPQEKTDLERQAVLTHLLFEMRPVYRQYENKPAVIMENISKALKLPVLMTSSGPSAMEKQYFFDDVRLK